jgi:hypothetical protein
MKKINKIINNETFIVLISAIAIIANTIVLVINNTRLEAEIKAYKSYYKSSEALFNEIEDYNENLFDSDKAIDYYKSKEELPISK